MAQAIAGDPDLVELARRIAEAEVDVLRVRHIRTDMNVTRQSVGTLSFWQIEANLMLQKQRESSL
jgi:hypothetical protein